MSNVRRDDERDLLIARLERENAELVDRLSRLRPALHGLTEDLVRAHRDTAEWRRRYRELLAGREAAADGASALVALASPHDEAARFAIA